MKANYEKRTYKGKEKVWAGKYHNLNNLPHWHLECELIYVNEGSIIVSHNHKEYILSAGEAIFLGSGEIHYIKSYKDSIVSIIMFDAKITRDITDRTSLISAKLSGDYSIPVIFEAIKEELDRQLPYYELKSREYIIDLIITIFRNEKLIGKNQAKEASTLALYKRLLDEMDEKYSSITFSDAAAFMGLSEPYFSKYFREISGMTFSQYLNIVKLDHAIELIKNSPHTPITEVAFACGFETIRHFNRVFKDTTGLSPKQMPKDYILDLLPIRKLSDAFDPTLHGSELL